MMRLYLLLGLILVLSPFALSGNSCHTDEIKKCLDMGLDWFTNLPKRSIPVTTEQVDHMCAKLETSFACADNYINSCMTPMQRELVDLTVEGIRDFRWQFCAKGSPQRASYEAHAECLNKVSQMDEVKKGLQYILAVLEKVPEVENNLKITYACCGYGKGYHDVLELVNNTCGEETVKAGTEFAGMILAQLPDVLCNGFTGKEDRCKAILPPDGTIPTENLKGTAIYAFVEKVLKNWLD